MTGQLLKRIGAFTALALLGVLLAGVASASAASPAWQMTIRSLPTNFEAGSSELGQSGEQPQYKAFALNTGGAPTSGPYTFTDTLPDGVMPLKAKTVLEDTGPRSCDISGQTVFCERSEPIFPGRGLQVFISVAVDADAPATIENSAEISGGGGASAGATTTTTISPDDPPYGFIEGPAGLGMTTTDREGQPVGLAGAHPYQITVDTGFPTMLAPVLLPAEHLKDIRVRLPRGYVVNPQATPVLCTEAELQSDIEGRGCPDASAIGVINVTTYLTSAVNTIAPLYNMVPPAGAPAMLGFDAVNVGIYVHLIGGVNSAGEYELSAESSLTLARQFNPIIGVQVELWGSPSDPSHDSVRGRCTVFFGECSVEPSDTPFLTMPSSCRQTAELSGTTSSWENPSKVDRRTTIVEDSSGSPIGVSGCNALEFQPTITSKATTNLADSPSGLDFSLHQPQNEDLDGLATAALKDVTVTLPEGMTLNASAANGLGSCTESQIGYAPVEGRIRFANSPQTCPGAAKLGAVEVKTPLLEEKLPGAVYLAKPYENPFDNLTAIYLAVEDEDSGIIAKLAGKVTSDPSTGQLSATFTENPELPIEDIEVHFFNGAGAALTTPLTCGTKTTTSTLTPWSTPEGADAHPTDSFETEVAAGGAGKCPSSEADAPNAPAFTAGTVSSQAGAYSPFVLRLARKDGTQRLTGIDATLPKGLTGKLAGIPYCSEAQIAQAQSRSTPNAGALEQASPSCPSSTEVGTIDVGAGSGPNPVYVSGHAYLAGPYRGAPLSLVAITPAVAGPFDLGTVVVRTALYVDPESAQIHAVSDPFPSILEGVPLDLRSVTLKMDRPDFTLNPTSCDPMSLTGAATTLTGQSALLNSRFQVGGCDALKFKPKLAIRLKGGTKRTRFPALRAELTFPKGAGANVEQAQVTLPRSAFLEQGHIGTICTRVQFAADQCPKASIYGKARAITPLLDAPLEGPVYLRSSNHKLPDLVAALDGQIEVDLVGRIDTGKAGGIRNTFESAPDAPVSKFVLNMFGGNKGLLVNSVNICRKPQRAKVSFTAQNGKVSVTSPLIANDCKGKKKKKKRQPALKKTR